MGDDPVQVTRHLTSGEAEEVSRLLARVRGADGHEPLADHKLAALEHGGAGFTGFMLRHADGALVAYAQVAPGHDGWGVEAAVDPERREAAGDLIGRLLAAVGDEVARRGGGRLRYWVRKPTEEADARALALGFVRDRDLLQLRAALPLDDALRGAGGPLEVRPFRPGVDEAAWLEANNRAFAHHPEQGGWDRATLVEREQLPWFDPAGFLLHEEGGRLAGSCWTKVHRDTSPAMGEIYVISVDPDFAHRGLGRALAVAGLDWLGAQGLTLAMLYVDADNEAATALYASLGFTLDHLDRAYVKDVAPGQVETPTRRPMP